MNRNHCWGAGGHEIMPLTHTVILGETPQLNIKGPTVVSGPGPQLRSTDRIRDEHGPRSLPGIQEGVKLFEGSVQ